MHYSVPRAGGLKEGRREQIQWFGFFYVMHITALFLEESLRDFSTGATRHFVTVVFLLYSCFIFYLYYLFTFPLSISSSTYLPFPFYCSLFCPSPKTFLTSCSVKAVVSTQSMVAPITLMGFLLSGPLLHRGISVMEPLGA